jgi:hypothetical protein
MTSFRSEMSSFLGGSQLRLHKAGEKAPSHGSVTGSVGLFHLGHLVMRTPTVGRTLSCLTLTSLPASLILLAESST